MFSVTLEALESMGAWMWIMFGIVLCAAELTVPGAFLIWIGFAAIAVGVLNIAIVVPTAWNLLIFSVLEIAFALIGRKFYGGAEKENPNGLNRRAQAMIGRVYLLDQEIGAHAAGRIRVDDSFWRVRGPALPAGAQVKIVAVDEDGVTLTVEKA